MIRFGNVVREFLAGERPVRALDGVSFEVSPGEFVAVAGKSGSGKSTLLNLASGTDAADSGEVEVAGRRLDRMDEAGLTDLRRRDIGMVFQFFNLLPTLSAVENVALPGLIAGAAPASTVKARAASLLADLGLTNRAAAWPDTLSGGEQQRVALARALVNDPAVILADEPTGNLDTETGAFVLNLLRDLAKKRGKTVLMVTHSPEALGYVDRVIRLRDGQVAAE